MKNVCFLSHVGEIFKKKKSRACKRKMSMNSGTSDMRGERIQLWGSSYIFHIFENVIMTLLFCTINIKKTKNNGKLCLGRMLRMWPMEYMRRRLVWKKETRCSSL
jgi:hypothetical protein